MPHVRMAIDLEVEKGDISDVVDVLFEKRKELADYASNVLLANDDKTESARVKPLGGNSHIHDPSELPCPSCNKYTNRAVLAAAE